MSKFSILCDSREKKPFTFASDRFSSHNNTIVTKLDQGDYSLVGYENIVCIERKASVEEIYSNLSSNEPRERFYREMERLSSIKYPFLVLAVDADQIMTGCEFSKASPIMIMSMLLGICMKYKINVIFAGRSAEFITYKILEKVWKEIQENKNPL